MNTNKTLIAFGIAILFASLAAPAAQAAEPGPQIVLCCEATNDLFRVLEQNGLKCARVATPAAAVAAAGQGGAVMILADGYPERTTVIEDTVLAAAAEKKLRMYVEYSAALPGLELGKPRLALVERAVVADDFFGPRLARLRILAINGLHFVPVTADKPHVVAARVAGFDTAVYGLPAKTSSILFVHPRGDILVSTTKLSHFLTGRYAPQDAWRALWAGVLGWLMPGQKIPDLRWTPTVRPAYDAAAALPADAERQALQRGLEWFRKSKLLMLPSREEEVRQAIAKGGPHPLAGSGLARTPAPDAPIGDGSMGILEAPLSHIQFDGSQLQSVSVRGDCNGEAAMAMALGAKALDQKEFTTIATNILDFYLFRSPARKNERGDPKHGAYGLSAWGITTPGWYGGNFGDDNARLLMGIWATAAATGLDRWNEAATLCLLANLRTAGQLGFRDDSLALGSLAKGWQPFFRRRFVSYSPHMESYLWACYLWGYHKTGDKLFLERAKTAIRMTMNAYTDGWRWTNGLAQEKARMLLPLAWLVRVEDTPEHRQWLRKDLDGLLALQQPCGAIREELGLTGRGIMPPPRSNEDYGKHECSIIQQNGDSVSDMLYTTNFALLGLHEAAAATGDKDIAAAEEKLAKFLCRIQVRSEAHPSLDGGWFRAFDFGRWEHWASNSDAGWGAWAIESGWTQGWIVGVLAMREMKTNLWDLTAGLKVKEFHDKLRPQMIPQAEVDALTGPTVRHTAVGKKVTVTNPFDQRYSAGGDGGLVNGSLGSDVYTDGCWQGYWGKDLEAVVDLGSAMAISEISTRYMQATSVGIFLPPTVEYALSQDGKEFRTVATLTAVGLANAVLDREAGPLVREFVTRLKDERVRYVRVRAKNIGKIPDWHNAKGLAAWLFVDEIVVK